MDESQNWYLLKHEDGALFGPVNLEQLKAWALEAQISPLDKVSNDAKSWFKAPMIPELQMDYLIEVSPDTFYGPTTIGAVREFLQMGELSGTARITNCRDGSESLIQDVPELHSEEEEDGPTKTSIRVNLQQRIYELEEALREEQRLREAAERTIERLEFKLAEVSRAASS